jgi:hypothetical protein
MPGLRPWKVLVAFSGLLFVLLFLGGCAGSSANTKSRADVEMAAGGGEGGPVPLYYDFEDVLVPSELKVDKDRSFVFEVPHLRAGLLVLNGRVETDSLVRFFEKNMVKDNWRLVSSFKSRRTIMFFNKPNRSCIVSITENRFSTGVEIWVAPNFEATEEHLLK